ncbi:hypothetical protein BGZ82_010816 [Podila clonocystis]|nr:hypothetical protein BGZ82_010816 [Podila clonocystis]
MVLLSKPSLLHITLFLGSCLWSSSPLASNFVAADPLTRDQLYAQNGFVQNWVAPMPSSPIRAANSSNSNNSGEKYLVQNWKTTFHTIAIGGNDISFVTDPFGGQPTAAGGTGTGTNSSISNQVLQLFYPKGSYAPSMGITGGTQFYAAPFGQQQFSKMMVSYDVAFPDGFIWQNGGKLPGIYGGAAYDGCSGGAQATGANCVTMRLMWRGSGAGEVYAYVPADPKSKFCQTPEVQCNDVYGKSIGRGLIYFRPGQWTRLDMIMSLNEPAGNQNGQLQVYMNGNQVISLDNIPYRTTGMVGFQGLMFSSFFGGSDPSYATPVDTNVFFRNVQLSVSEPAPLYDGSGSGGAATVSRTTSETVLLSIATMFIIFVLS